MNFHTLNDIEVKGKCVIVRVDFNVPMEKGKITDETRIVKTLPTIQYLIKHSAKVILISHLGRPKNQEPELSLKPIANRLGQLLKQPVKFAPDCIGKPAQKEIETLKNGSVALLENLRFHKEEEKNDPKFSKSLAELGDFYVNDAFGAAHRAHASTAGITEYLPSAAGFLLAKEIESFDRILEKPERPFTAILGGSKVIDKIKVIENLMSRVDYLLIGGAMAYTFLKARGHKIGSSKFDFEGLEVAKQILEKTKQVKIQFLLPIDHVIAEMVTEGAKTEISEVDIPDGWIGVDIGPKTIERYKTVISKSKTVMWNGPVGVFEIKAFSEGTSQLAEAMAQLSGATTVIGGGETAAAIVKSGLENKFSHVSTGGGASLEYLEGRTLPGIDALIKSKQSSSKKPKKTESQKS